LAFKNVAFSELATHFSAMNYGWLLPYFIIVIISHYARAERWLLFVESKTDKSKPKKITLFTGVMVGYLVNYAVPRLGEISRSVYVSRKENLPASNLFGTIILERILDLLCLGILLILVAVYFVSDSSILINIFGDRIINYITSLSQFKNIVLLIVSVSAGLISIWVLVKSMENLSRKFSTIDKLYSKFTYLNKTFWNGILAIKNVDNWLMFLVWTAVIWIGYILMVYIPFWMFNLQLTYNLNILDAIAIMTIASIGIVLPSPGGVGTYHYFVKQALLFLSAVPAAIGLAFGLVTHAVMMISVVIITLVMLFIDRKGGPGLINIFK